MDDRVDYMDTEEMLPPLANVKSVHQRRANRGYFSTHFFSILSHGRVTLHLEADLPQVSYINSW